MAPLHKRGDLCFVHPGRPCLAGDSVIIQIRIRKEGPSETYIKTLVKLTEEWIVAKQYNPPCEVEYKRETVIQLHHVLTVNEMFGI